MCAEGGALNSIVMHHFSRRVLMLAGALALTVATPAIACSPRNPGPTLRDQRDSAERVYMARLVSLKRTPHEDATYKRAYPHYAIEDAEFQILMTLKGVAPKNGRIKTRTSVFNGNCAISVKFPALTPSGRYPEEQLRDSDIWILFLRGTEPYMLDSSDATSPINGFSEEGLRFLLKGSEQ